MEYYKILKINANSSKEDIKSAYQRIVEKCHSELVSPHDEKSYNDKMHTLWLANEAYAVLANQKLRN
jgi:DnaJ-class molecular chaperone